MPIYDFQCTNCGLKDELMRKSSEVGTIMCPTCSQETFSKMLSAPSFQLSGSGWYATDFKDKKSVKTEDTAKASVTDAPAAKCAPGCACH